MKRATWTLVVALALVAVAAPAAADDEHRCYGDTNVIYGSLDRDRLIGSRCDDLIVGFWGSDLIIARGGEDVVLGGGGRDVIHAADGEEDTVRGGGGFDRCVVDTIDTWARCESVRVVLP
jgi:Ca2+-binding RTX toxin-like protein